jgi:hypothetical protein
MDVMTEQGQIPVGQPDAFGPPGTRLLVVEAARMVPGRVLSDPSRSVIIARFASIDRMFLDRVGADIVAAPLFGAVFDILDLIDRLLKGGYQGHVVALSGRLPDASVVERDIRGHAGLLTIEIVQVPQIVL